MLLKERDKVGSEILGEPFSSGKFLGFGDFGKTQIKFHILTEQGRTAESMDMRLRMLYQNMRIS